jgi:DNA-directed RNA polymerase I, II, and III subunit RPABC1
MTSTVGPSTVMTSTVGTSTVMTSTVMTSTVGPSTVMPSTVMTSTVMTSTVDEFSISQINQESHDIFRSFNVVKQMLRDRKIDISILEATSDKELFEIFKKDSDIFQIKVNDQLIIIYHMKSKFIKSDLKTFLKQVDISSQTKLLFIFKQKIHENNEKNIKDLIKETKYEYFKIKHLLFNITHHSIVPKHEILSIDETNKIMERYDVKSRSQFPKILATDPVARYYDVQPGQLVKITRSSTSTGENVTYRFCV